MNLQWSSFFFIQSFPFLQKKSMLMAFFSQRSDGVSLNTQTLQLDNALIVFEIIFLSLNYFENGMIILSNLSFKF
jgi:hypothetical protein